MWDQIGVDSVSVPDQFGVKSLWVRLVSLWGKFGATLVALGSLWNHFWVTLTSFWDPFGTYLESFVVNLG